VQKSHGFMQKIMVLKARAGFRIVFEALR